MHALLFHRNTNSLKIYSFIRFCFFASFQIHLQVGSRHIGYWCVRDFDHPLLWRSAELYLLTIILIIPTLVMSYSYGQIIREVCQVVKQRKNLTQNYGKSKRWVGQTDSRRERIVSLLLTILYMALTYLSRLLIFYGDDDLL